MGKDDLLNEQIVRPTFINHYREAKKIAKLAQVRTLLTETFVKRGISQKRLAEGIGYSRVIVGQWAMHRCLPSEKAILRWTSWLASLEKEQASVPHPLLADDLKSRANNTAIASGNKTANKKPEPFELPPVDHLVADPFAEEPMPRKTTKKTVAYDTKPVADVSKPTVADITDNKPAKPADIPTETISKTDSKPVADNKAPKAEKPKPLSPAWYL